ncbi:DUF5689 domain-containing protein [Pedobacter sp. D749]|uniref:DUF5689 domain-containing protein n=1 Tax=Pedobacter sp. D749 TaxID=2856523 RepID=UPI001C596E98|nr:DUF5689 domain-containing protein [Pedobacter sp. D749]QXU43894.1 hypothetical protein KYH19_10015 [Pedobacter sp. D749]
MKNKLKYFLLLAAVVITYTSCKKENDYRYKFSESGFISNFDLRRYYKGSDLSLNPDVIGGATSIRGVVVSDFRSGNSVAGLIALQNSRINGTADSLRGISFNIGTAASDYIPGDSLHIKLDGGILKRVDGILQITGITNSAITKIASGRKIKLQAANTSAILANPDRYESTLVAINNAVYDPEPASDVIYSGDKILNDGFGLATLRTSANATFANAAVQPSGNFTGVVYVTGTGTSKKIEYRMRTAEDFFYVPMPKLSPAIISGFLVDPNSTDGNYEYVQFLATKDIDFALTPFSVYTSNNAGATTFPTLGWNTGALRTYKFNLTSGSVKKGEFFYVGGAGQRINGSASTVIPASKWISSVNYTTVPGADGVGNVTGNLLANSGNVAGIAIFEGINVTPNSTPLDVIFYGGANGSFYTAGPPEYGLRITITDKFATYAGKVPQEYYGKGTNDVSKRFAGFPAATSFARLGGVYKATKGGWESVRTMISVTLTNTSVLSEIETGGVTTLIDK